MFGSAAVQIMQKPIHIVIEYLAQVNRQLDKKHYENVKAALVPNWKQADITEYLGELQESIMTDEERAEKYKQNFQKLKRAVKKINEK